MIPTVASLHSFDIYRDGGSMSASFRDKDGVLHQLVFPIDLYVRHELHRLGYKPPVLETFQSNDYTSPVTGVTYPSWRLESTDITWEVARGLLRAMAPLVDGFATDYPIVYPTMVDIAASDGVVGA